MERVVWSSLLFFWFSLSLSLLCPIPEFTTVSERERGEREERGWLGSLLFLFGSLFPQLSTVSGEREGERVKREGEGGLVFSLVLFVLSLFVSPLSYTTIHNRE